MSFDILNRWTSAIVYHGETVPAPHESTDQAWFINPNLSDLDAEPEPICIPSAAYGFLIGLLIGAPFAALLIWWFAR